MNISLIIPNYNGADLLSKNIPHVIKSVEKYGLGKVEIIIPDDASTDNSVDVINKFIKLSEYNNIMVKTVINKDKKNRGFARNVNRAARIATGDVIILINTDVSPKVDFLNKLLPHFKDSKVFAVGCMDISIENSQRIERGRGIGRWHRGLLMHGKGELTKNNTLWASGGSSAFSRDIWKKLGGLEELYSPFYWEDIDISYRALKSGYKIIFEKESVVVHEHEKGTIKFSYKKSFIKKISYRNQFLFVWLNITDPNLILAHFLWLPYHLFNAVLSGDLLMITGFLEAVYMLGKVSISRSNHSISFTISDQKLLAQFST